MIGIARQLSLQLNTTAGVGTEVLHVVAKNFVVANDGHHVVRGVDGDGKDANLLDRARDTGGADENPRP